MSDISESLQKEIKAMEKKKKAPAAKKVEAPKAEKVEKAPKVAIEPTMSFEAWWMGATKEMEAKLPIWIKDVLKAEFVSRGLKNLETKAVYDAALAAYGIKR